VPLDLGGRGGARVTYPFCQIAHALKGDACRVDAGRGGARSVEENDLVFVLM
jgi:hypothetical protein